MSILSRRRLFIVFCSYQSLIGWLDLLFYRCTSSQDYYGGYFADNAAAGDGENADGGNYYYNNEQREGYQGMYVKQMVHFRLCPTGQCTFCQNGADYVVDLSVFIDAYLEGKMTAMQYKCEQVRENCYCDNAYNADACLASCMTNAGLGESDCVEEGNGNNNNFSVQAAIECTQLEVDETAMQAFYYASGNGQQQNGQNGRKELFVGPCKCPSLFSKLPFSTKHVDTNLSIVLPRNTDCASNGRSIHLGVFSEETCSYPAPKNIYEALHYGNHLPYAKKSLVDSGCVSCKEPTDVNNQNQDDQQDADDVTTVCSTLYSSAAKCEEKIKGYMPYRDNYGCEYIKSLQATSVIPGANVTAKAFAGIFGITTIILAAVALVLGKRASRQNVSLTEQALA